MRRTSRMVVVALLVVSMTSGPAMAWWSCSGCYGGGYHSYSYGPSYYWGPTAYGSGCGGGVVVNCGGGCSSCGDCGDCGPCDGCSDCGEGTLPPHDAVIHEGAPDVWAPTPPADDMQPMPPPTAPRRQPSAADRPVGAMPPPQLPAQPAPTLQPAPVEPPVTQPAPTPPAPTPPPAPPQPEENDLFGAPPATQPPAPAPEQPAEDEDLFGPATAPPADAGTPPPAPTPPASDDDLFGAPPATEEPPAEEKPTEEPPAEDDDIFGATDRVLREPGGLASHELRTWVDNTGSYACQGRLVRFLDGQVRILKENGRTTTVPLSRLSAGDLEFVSRQAAAQQGRGIQTVQSATLPLLAN